MTDTRDRTRNEELLHLLSNGWMSLLVLSRLFDCPEASIRRSIHELRQAGYFIEVRDGHVTSHGLRSPLIPHWNDSMNIGGDDDADYQR